MSPRPSASVLSSSSVIFSLRFDRHIVFARGGASLIEGLGIVNDLGMSD